MPSYQNQISYFFHSVPFLSFRRVPLFIHPSSAQNTPPANKMTSENMKFENLRYCRSNVDLFTTLAQFVQSFKSACHHTNLATIAGGGTVSPPAESAIVDEMMRFMLNNPSLVPKEVLPVVPNSSAIDTKSWFVNFAAEAFVKTGGVLVDEATVSVSNRRTVS
jgi:hypothetical protein